VGLEPTGEKPAMDFDGLMPAVKLEKLVGIGVVVKPTRLESVQVDHDASP